MKSYKKIVVMMLLVLLLVPFSYADVNGTVANGNVIVNFDTGENTVPIDDISIKEGSKVPNYIYTERYGYFFEGWQKDGVLFDIENTPINESITLIPKWVLKDQYYNEDPLLYRDDRFEDGYPRYFEENDKLYLDVKLKEDVKDATISMIYKDKSSEADVECVLHGHFGVKDMELDDADNYETIVLDGGQERRIELEEPHRDYGRLGVGAFVISTSDRVSEKPTIVVRPYKDVYNGGTEDSYFRAYSAYIGQDGKSVLVECSNDIDKSSKLSISDFKMTLNGKSIAINSVEVLESPYNIGFKVDNLSSLVEKYNISGKEEAENDLRNLKLEYLGNSLRDVENNHANNNSFNDVWFTVYERPEISGKILSPQKDRMVFIIKGTILDYIDGRAYYNGKEMFFDNMDSRWGDNTFSTIYDFNNPLNNDQIEKSDYVVDYMSESYSFLDPTFKNIAKSKKFSMNICKEVVIKEANYEINNRQLRVLLSNHLDMSNDYLDVLACSFVINVDGQDIMLKGTSNDIYTYEGVTELEFYVDSDLNITPESKVTLKYKALHLSGRPENDDYYHLKNQAFQSVKELDKVDVIVY